MAQAPGEPLPEALEEEVLAILDGEDATRETRLLALLDREPAHAEVLRRWLAASGVVVGATLPGPAAAEAGAGSADALPRRLGAYELRALLGRGGFGSVYRAEQLEPIRRPVAVKVLNPGMDSREVLARFTAEREALNRMDHPGIARLLDAGQTPQGRPFFVMELVEGPPLATFCKRENLPLDSRLRLFLMVLEAMEHAHQKAVLHRDLSANNVLVADPHGRPQPKIIDFGIAKSLSTPLLQGGAMTFQGTLMGTPEFMSPEQASGRVDDVDTRADVYALGVQLYELLTDQLPIPGNVLRAAGITDMARQIAEHPVALPSNVAPPPRRAALRGDLDAIVMKAVAKARDERYPTIAAFAADLRAHLADEPVAVAAPTTWVRLRKFVRRHRAQSLAAALVAISLLTTIGILVWALGVANQARLDAEAQQATIRARADDGFRLLANEDRLATAIAAAAELPPPWPEHAGALAGWLNDHGQPLLDELPKIGRKLEELRHRRGAGPDGGFLDDVDRHLYGALGRLQKSLVEFADERGTHGRVLHLQQLADRVALALTRDAAAWSTTLQAIRQSQGGNGGRDYGGVTLPPQPGLTPLGRHPRTGLFEFLDLLSHAPGAPQPARDPVTGDLEVGPDTGIVFVLVPRGMFRIGAFRGEPGLPQNDPDAEDDELRGPLTTLDEFLIARTELTVGQWAALAGEPRSGDPRLPLGGRSWFALREVLRRFDLDLPTEAQWEYACRGGTVTPWWCGDATTVGTAGWFGARPVPVGGRPSNPFGLCDVHGNVAEWCRDALRPYAGVPAAPGDGFRGPRDGTPESRVVRGGACFEGPTAARSAARDERPADRAEEALGLRPIRWLRRRGP